VFEIISLDDCYFLDALSKKLSILFLVYALATNRPKVEHTINKAFPSVIYAVQKILQRSGRLRKYKVACEQPAAPGSRKAVVAAYNPGGAVAAACGPEPSWAAAPFSCRR
jgi:hypothetical protein